MKTTLLLLIFSLITLHIRAQITEEQAFPVDSMIAHTHLTAVNIHAENIHTTPTDSYLIWDAVNGMFGNTMIAYSFTHRVDEEIANEINSVEGKEYRLFDLEDFSDSNQYQIAVESWLSELGLPVNTGTLETIESTIFPNPVSNIATLQSNIPAGVSYIVKIHDNAGRLIHKHKGISADNNLNIQIDFSQFNSGIYMISFHNKISPFNTQVIKN